VSDAAHPANRSPNGELWLRNQQSRRRINLRLLRQILVHLTNSRPSLRFTELGISLVDADEITRLNEAFLQHAGSTDVITFDYCEPRSPRQPIQGEIFICVDEAVAQARRFRTAWQSEMVRYAVHGLLHLGGFDDRRAAQRRQMKKVEDEIIRELARKFRLRDLGKGLKAKS
jgi:rRNA maturation RNase YbeY